MSSRQNQILSYIRESVRGKGYPPSIREIGEAVGLRSSSTVHGHLAKLENLGFIKRDPTKPRTIDVLDEAILAVENIEEVFPMPTGLIGEGDNIFILTVEGDSMIGVGIYNDDYVFVREQHTANNSDIIVALIAHDTVTVKRFYKEIDCIRLQPAKYESVICP